MKRFFIPLLLILSVTSIGLAQLPEKAAKKREKAREKLENGKVEDARKILRDLVNDYKWAGSCWDLLCQTELQDYLNKKQSDNLFQNITITTKKDGKEVENDSSALLLLKLLQNSSPAKIQYKNFLNTCREATINSPNVETVSILLRMYEFDPRVDTAIKKTAIEQFNKAEEEFQKKNFAEAIKYYKKASELDTTFYKARLYLGDAYYANKEYEEATKYFKEAIRVKPNMCEPRKYLTDAYIGQGLYELAQKECIKSLEIFPDIGMFFKLETIANGRGKKFDRLWMSRAVFPSFAEDQTYNGSDKEWQIYLDALKEIRPYCNEKGVITKQNSLTTSKYAEVYAWEKVLKTPEGEKYKLMKQLQGAGWLESYLLFSCYHYDLHGQYKHYVNNNPGKIEAYVDFLLTLG